MIIICTASQVEKQTELQKSKKVLKHVLIQILQKLMVLCKSRYVHRDDYENNLLYHDTYQYKLDLNLIVANRL